MKNCKLVLTFVFMCFSVLVGKSQIPAWETMKYGLFVHFVYGEEYGLMTPMTYKGGEPKDINDFANNFDVEKFADDVEAMGFEYVIFTAWHANMNLLYPSKVMKKWRGAEHTCKRDLLGELFDALIERNIKPCIYTHIWVGNDFHPKGDGYYYYGNKNGIITEDQKKTGYPESVEGNSEIWDNFVNEVYDEMSSRYGEKVAAYWFDGTWCWHVDKTRIMETIRKTNKICAFIGNGTNDQGMPYNSKEVGSPVGSDYSFEMDYPQVEFDDVTTWPSYERNVAIIQGGNWWASVNGKPKFSAEDVYRYTVLQAGTNNNGGVSWAFAPFVDGNWEGDMLERMKKAYSYMKPVEESIKNTRASIAYPTPEGSKINNLKWGFVATMSPDRMYHYIHVLCPPKGNMLCLPEAKDGIEIRKAYLLKDVTELKVTTKKRSGVKYTIEMPEGFQWDKLNTVIKLEMW